MTDNFQHQRAFSQMSSLLATYHAIIRWETTFDVTRLSPNCGSSCCKYLPRCSHQCQCSIIIIIVIKITCIIIIIIIITCIINWHNHHHHHRHQNDHQSFHNSVGIRRHGWRLLGDGQISPHSQLQQFQFYQQYQGYKQYQYHQHQRTKQYQVFLKVFPTTTSQSVKPSSNAASRVNEMPKWGTQYQNGDAFKYRKKLGRVEI